MQRRERINEIFDEGRARIVQKAIFAEIPETLFDPEELRRFTAEVLWLNDEERNLRITKKKKEKENLQKKKTKAFEANVKTCPKCNWLLGEFAKKCPMCGWEKGLWD
jgi:rubrerythrin